MFGWFVIGALGLLLVLATVVIVVVIKACQSDDGHHL